MDRSDSKTGIDRRSMLKRTAVVGGLLAMPGSGALRSAIGDTSASDVNRLGLLVPSGDRYRPLAAAVKRGAAEATAGTAARTRLVEQTGRLRPAIDTMLHEEGFDAILCFANTIEARELSEAAEGARRSIHLIDSGVNPVDPRVYSPWLTVSTLDYFGKNRAIGRAAAERGARTGVALVTSAVSGYQTTEAIREGFEGGGGAIERYIVVDRPELDELDVVGVSTALAEISPDVVFLLGDRTTTGRLESLVRSARIVRDHREDLADGLRRLAREAVAGLTGSIDAERGLDNASGGVPVHSWSDVAIGSSPSGLLVPYAG